MRAGWERLQRRGRGAPPCVRPLLRRPAAWQRRQEPYSRGFRSAAGTMTEPRPLRPRTRPSSWRSRPNELWHGDDTPRPAYRRPQGVPIAFLDDHSRAVMAARWGYFEDSGPSQAGLRRGRAGRGGYQLPGRCPVHVRDHFRQRPGRHNRPPGSIRPSTSRNGRHLDCAGGRHGHPDTRVDPARR